MALQQVLQKLGKVLAVGAVVLLLSQCVAGDSDPNKQPPGGSDESCVGERMGPEMPGGKAVPIFIAQSHAYYMDADTEVLQAPHLVVYSDGTAARAPARPDTESADNDPIMPLRGGWIDSCAFDELLAALDEISTADYGSMPSVMDGGYSTFEIRSVDGQRTTSLKVDQFGAESKRDPDLSRAEVKARERLHAVVDAVKEAFIDEGELPDQLRVVTDAGWDPAADIPKWEGITEYPRCSVYAGEPAVEIRAKLEEAIDLLESPYISGRGEVVFFTDPHADSSEPVGVGIAQVMPGIDACAKIEPW